MDNSFDNNTNLFDDDGYSKDFEAVMTELRRQNNARIDKIGEEEFKVFYNICATKFNKKEMTALSNLVGIIVNKMQKAHLFEYFCNVVEAGKDLQMDGELLKSLLELSLDKQDITDMINRIETIDRYNSLVSEDEKLKY